MNNFFVKQLFIGYKVISFLTVLIIMFLAVNVTSCGGSKLENTTWSGQNRADQEVIVSFGKTDFDLNAPGQRFSGTYTISGDKVTLFFSNGSVEEWTLRGDTIVSRLGRIHVKVR